MSQRCSALFTLLGACIGIVPLTMKGIYAIVFSWFQYVPTFLRRDTSGFQRWLREEFDQFSASPTPCRFGIGYAVFAVIAFWLGGAFDGLPAVMLIAGLVLALLASFVCGVGLAALYYLAHFIWLVGRRYPVRVSDHGYGILSTGRTLVKCYGLVAIAWCFYTASATWSLNGRWIPLLALASPAVLFFVGSFVFCQFPLHTRMVECKRASLLELDNLLEQLTPKAQADMSEERRRQVDFCMAEIKRVREWPEWPFSFINLSGVMGASMGAIAPQIIKTILPLIVGNGSLVRRML